MIPIQLDRPIIIADPAAADGGEHPRQAGGEHPRDVGGFQDRERLAVRGGRPPRRGDDAPPLPHPVPDAAPGREALQHPARHTDAQASPIRSLDNLAALNVRHTEQHYQLHSLTCTG